MDQSRRMQTVMNVLGRSTIHGLNHVSTADSKVTKTFWLILFLIGVSGFSINLVFIADRYYSKPILTSYITEHEAFIWPDITFCNPTAPYALMQDKSVRNEYDKLMAKADTFKNHSLFMTIDEFSPELPNHSIVSSSLDHYAFKLSEYTNHFNLIGLDMGFKGIYLINDFYNSVESPNQSDIEGFVYSRYLQMRLNIPCHTFQVSRVYSEADLRSLELITFLVKSNFDSYYYMNSGYMQRGVFIHINLPNKIPETDGHMIFPGFNYNIFLTMTRNQFSRIKRNCREEIYKVELYHTNLIDTQIYEGSYKDCKKISSQQLYFENCNCYSPFLPLHKTSQVPPRLCLNISIFNESQIKSNADCLLRVYRKYKSAGESHDVIEKKCVLYKRTKCEHRDYTIDNKNEMLIELWTEQYNPRRKQFVDLMAFSYLNSTKNDSVGEIKRNLATITIRRTSAYGNLVREDLEYPLSELISDVGGLMGLWIGLSVVGMFEVIEFLLHLCQISRFRNIPISRGKSTNSTKQSKRHKYRQRNKSASTICNNRRRHSSEQNHHSSGYCRECRLADSVPTTIVQIPSDSECVTSPLACNGTQRPPCHHCKHSFSPKPSGFLATEYVYSF